MNPASSATRGTTLERSSHSAGAWSSPPTGPSPSIVGVPAADVVLASEAPPVAASRSSNPSSPATATAMSTRRAAPSFFSIGRCQPFPTTWVVTSGTTCSAQIRSISASAASSVSSSGERRSTWSSHRSATTFVRVPPVDDADVHGDAGPATVEPLQRDDRVRGLEHRVATLLGLDAGVRRAAR